MKNFKPTRFFKEVKQEGNKICARKNRRVSRERVKKVCGSFDEGGVGLHPLIIILRTLR